MTMTYTSAFCRLSAAALCVAVLGGCGVKSAPQHPEGSSYPGTYPAAQDAPPPLRGRVRSRDANETAPAPASGIYSYPNSPTYRPPEK